MREFVLSACTNELGLEVPGHHQAASPLDPDSTAKGLDLTQPECDALVAYVRGLGAPVEPNLERAPRIDGYCGPPSDVRVRRLLRPVIDPSLGESDGIYSDLLLHDMGPALSDSGSYYGISEPDSSVRRTG